MTKRRSFIPTLEEFQVSLSRTGNRSASSKPAGSGLRTPKKERTRHGQAVR